MNLRLRLLQVRRALQSPSIRTGLVVLVTAGLAVGGLLVIFPRLAPGAGLNLVVTFAAAVAGVYLSQALIVQRVFRTDRDRVDPPAAVRERYKERVRMLEPTRSQAVAGVDGSPLPVTVVEGAFTGFGPAEDAVLEDSVYTFGPALEAFLEPRFDELSARFGNERRPNRRLLRVTGVTDARLHLAETSYFRTYCTNLSPDFEGETEGRSLRAAFEDDLVDADGGLVPLGETPFSDALSGGGLVVTTDGRTIVGLRPLDVAVDELELVDSFGDHLGATEAAGGGVRRALCLEAADALEPFAPEQVVSVYGLGMVRRLDWLGHPNAHAVLLVSAPGGLSHSGDEHLDTVTVDIEGWERVEPEDLVDPALAGATVRAILEASEEAGYDPGVTLMTTLELWLREAGAGEA